MANFNKTEQQHEIKISAEASNALKEFQKIAGQLKSLEKDTETTSNKFDMFKQVIAGLALVQLANLTKQSIDAADAFNDMSARTGIAASTLTSYQLASKMAGTSVEDVAKGLNKLSKTMQAANTGSVESQNAFAQLGVSYLDSSGKLKTSEQVMLELSDVFKQMPDGVFKTSAAMSLFGKSGTDLIPLLNMGKDGIKGMQEESANLGITLSDKTLQSVNDFNDSLDKSTLIGKNGIVTLVSDYLPGLTQLANIFNTTAGSILQTNEQLDNINDTSKLDWIYGFITELGLVGDVFQALKNIVVVVFELIKDYFVITGSLLARFAVAFESVIKGDFKSATRAFSGFGDQLKDMYKDVGKTIDTQFTEERFSTKIKAALDKSRQVVQESNNDIKKDYEKGVAEQKKVQEASIKILEDSIKKQEEVYNKAKSLRDKSLEDTKSLSKEFDKLIKDATKSTTNDKNIGYDDVVNSINKTGSLNYRGESDNAIQQAKDTVDIIKKAFENGNLTEYDRDRFLQQAKSDALEASKAKEALAAAQENEELLTLQALKNGKTELEKPVKLTFDDASVTSEAERIKNLIQASLDKNPISISSGASLPTDKLNNSNYQDPAKLNNVPTSTITLNFGNSGQVNVSATSDEASNLQNIVNKENLKAGL